MQINLIAIGKRMPSWVTEGYQEYAKRLPRDYSLNLIELEAGKRTKGTDIARLTEQEGDLMLSKIAATDLVIALDVKGKAWDTHQLSKHLLEWHDDGQDISVLVGGPEGLAQKCLNKAAKTWSFSPLTLPHPLVRVIVAEQLYRAWSILAGHPYHR